MATAALYAIDLVMRETMLFAAVGFLIGGVDDLTIDLLFFARAGRERMRRAAHRRCCTVADLPAPRVRAPIAIFVAAWDESAVIGAMLTTALARFGDADYRLYVGVYPNDRATIDAVAKVAERDPRCVPVIGAEPGPTTKAACLNTLWHALRRDEAAGMARVKAVVIHDAEDVVHADELTVFDRLVDDHAVVQLPVLPLVDLGSRLVSGHYIDEFAESHAKSLVVREALGASLPLAGVGCAIARAMLDRIAVQRDGAPFDIASLTEDYDLGLKIASLGGRGCFARLAERRGGPPVAVRAYFPATLDAAVRQKARWMVGIALAGWDRNGWGRWSDWREHWMRMRDRRAPLAVLVLGAAYLALVAWALALGGHWLAGGAPTPLPPAENVLLTVNAVLLAWRLAMRALFTGRTYGRREAMLAVPRALVGNLVALLAARRAMVRYLDMLAGGAVVWDKTQHHFPDLADASTQR